MSVRRTPQIIAAALVMAVGIPAASASAAPKSKIRFSTASYQQQEDAGAKTITLTRTRNLRSPATVQYSTVAGTASAGSDYTDVSGTIVFPAVTDNGVKTQEMTFEVPVADDAAIEANETVTLRLRALRGAAGGATAVLTILDDDGNARVSFASATESAAENSGSVAIEVLRAGDLTGPVDVGYGVTGGTAAGSDYSLPADGTIHFGDGEFLKSIPVGLVDNASQDPHKTLALTLESPLPSLVQAPDTTTLTIIDDESPAQLRFELDSVSVEEGDATGLAQVTVTRAGSYTGETVSATYATSDLTALAGSDYTASTGTVVLEGPDPTIEGDTGEESVVIEIPIAADALDEADETFAVTLSEPSEGAQLGTDDTATVTIRDDDATAGGGNGGGDTGGGTASDPPPSGSTLAAGAEQGIAQPLSVQLKVLRKRLLRKRGVKLQIVCSADCSLKAIAKLRVPGRKAIKLRKALPELAAGQAVKTKLRLSKKRKRAVRRALDGRKRLRVVTTIRATDASGATVTVKRKRKLRV